VTGRRQRPSRHLQVADPAAKPEVRNVITPTTGMDARAVIASFAAQHADTVALITDQATDAVVTVIANHGFEGRIDDGGTLRAAVFAVVVNRFRDFVVARLIETHQNPALLEGRTDREALVYLLSVDDRDRPTADGSR
jgi:hypothetical protein